jgi:3D (Asp-Asp-Asp) domain-containing protein
MMKTLQKINGRKIEIIVLMVLVFEFVFPHYTLAQEFENSLLLPNLVMKAVDRVAGDLLLSEANSSVSLIAAVKDYEVVDTYEIPISAYSSTVDQCDDTPCITASGFDLCAHNQEDVIAANFLPLGTKVRIPEYFGDRIFTVEDRMNARYYYKADIWMKDRASALVWGVRHTTIEVIK